MIKFCVKLVQRWLPEPFIFAIILTLVAGCLAMPICQQTPLEVVEHWGDGVWNLLAFAMQMSLVLVCGSTLAAAPVVKKAISSLANIPRTPVAAIALVTAVSALACWLNWGFGLIVGVVFAKEIARKLPQIDYRLLIASAYSGFVVWHAGLSGSIPLTMATPGEALTKATNGVLTAPVPISQTILSPYNIVIVLVVMLAIVITNSLMYPKKDVVAVDPDIIPYGSILYIVSNDGQVVYGYAVAGDTGGALWAGTAIVDLYYNTYDECCQFGRRDVTIYVLEGVSEDITY